MSVRKRTWKSPNGEPKEAWVVDYVDQHGDRHLKTFAKKRDADAHHAIVGSRRPRRHPYRRQQERHRRQGRRAVARELRGGRTGAHDARRLPAACRAPHRARARGAEALAAHGAAGARLRGTAAQGRALAGDGAQGAALARRAARRRTGARPRRPERRPLPAHEPPRQGPARRAATASSRVGVDIPTPDEMRAIVAHARRTAGGRCC